MLSCEAFNDKNDDNSSNVGACRILLEGKLLFDFIDRETDFSGYKLLILPDEIRVDEELAARLRAYIAQGGKALLTGRSGLKVDADEFALDVGARFVGENPFRPNYMIPEYDAVNGKTAYVMYEQGYLIERTTGEAFAQSGDPYFNRQPFFFSSHQHTPNDPEKTHIAAVQKGGVVYIGWNAFRDYAIKGELHVKEMVLHAVERLLPSCERRVSVRRLPDRGVVTVTRQGARDVVHLLFAHTTVRGKGIEVIEDAVPLYNVSASLKRDERPSRVYLAPQMQEIPFEYEDGSVRFTVDCFTLHQMIAVE